MKNKNSESLFKYDANLTSVITMELNFFCVCAILISRYSVITFGVINVKNFRENLRYFF